MPVSSVDGVGGLRAYTGDRRQLEQDGYGFAGTDASAPGAQRGEGDLHARSLWRAVEQHRVRAPQFFKESIGYPRRILLVLEPVYLNAGWPGTAVC